MKGRVEYNAMLDKLFAFERNHLILVPSLVEVFNTPASYNFTSEITDTSFAINRKPYFDSLFIALANLCELVPEDKTAPMYLPIRDFLFSAMLLTKHYANPKTYHSNQHLLETLRKITALTETTIKFTDFLKAPGDEPKRVELFNANKNMLAHIAPHLLQQENRWYFGISGAVELSIGMALFFCWIPIMALPSIAALTSIAVLFAGVGLLIHGSLNFAASLVPFDHLTTLAKPMADSVYDVCAPTKVGFFSRKTSLVLPEEPSRENNLSYYNPWISFQF